MHKIIFSTILISTILLIAVAAPSVVLPIGMAHAQISAPPTGAPSQAHLASITNGWWKWIFSVDTTKQPNPFSSFFTGDCSVLQQPNRLMFLVGTASPGGGVQNHGTCNVPAGTSILFPLLNSECSFLEFPTLTISNPHTAPFTSVLGEPFQQLRTCTDVSGATNLVATLDGKLLQPTRASSGPGGFQLIVVPNNPFGIPVNALTSTHSVADGHWVLLPPLPAGQHTVSFGGCLPSLNFCTGTVVFNLRVQ